jgi:hypothetical protein
MAEAGVGDRVGVAVAFRGVCVGSGGSGVMVIVGERVAAGVNVAVAVRVGGSVAVAEFVLVGVGVCVTRRTITMFIRFGRIAEESDSWDFATGAVGDPPRSESMQPKVPAEIARIPARIPQSTANNRAASTRSRVTPGSRGPVS